MDTALFAALHHALAFALVGILAAELAMLRPDMTAPAQKLLGRVDLFYGLAFVALLVVGLARVYWYEKGAEYYGTSLTFWAKMAALAVITLLSLPPTFAYLGWGRRRRANPDFRPDTTTVTRLRRYLWAQAVLYPVIGLFAALMARGI